MIESQLSTVESTRTLNGGKMFDGRASIEMLLARKERSADIAPQALQRITGVLMFKRLMVSDCRMGNERFSRKAKEGS